MKRKFFLRHAAALSALWLLCLLSGHARAADDSYDIAVRSTLYTDSGNAHDYRAYTNAEVRRLAEVLNTYRDLLGEDGTVHLLSAPVSPVVNSITMTGEYDGFRTDLYEVLQPMVKDGVYIYDAEEMLMETMFDEYDYLSCDHHWAPRGASRFADEMMANQGIPEAGYYEYLYRLRTEYYSGINHDRAELEEMEPPQNNIQVQVPVTPVKAYDLLYLTQKTPCPYLLDVRIEEYDFYSLYMTGMLGGWRTYETGFHTGRDALIFGDSFNTAFVPFIVPYYDNVTVVDLRDNYYVPELAGASIREYMEEYGADDVYIVACSWTALSSTFFQQRMIEYLESETP